MQVGEYIRKLRIEKGLSQEELGKVIGVQRAAVQKWESGKTQNLKRTTIQKLSDFFGVSPVLFISEVNEEEKVEAELRKKYEPIVEMFAKELLLTPAVLYDAGIIELISNIENMANSRVSYFLKNNTYKDAQLAFEVFNEVSELSENDIETILDMIKILKERLNKNNN